MPTTEFWYVFTALAEPWFLLFLITILFVIYFIMQRRKSEHRFAYKRFLTLFLISMAITYSSIIMLKMYIPVPRACVPCPGAGCNPYCPDDSSFPSGHSAMGFALFTSIYLAVGKKKLLPVFILPLLIAYSRLALGVHTLPDVVAGSVLGFGIALIVNEVVVKRKLNAF
jgi:membrane-associated phospholipid phosphatase